MEYYLFKEKLNNPDPNYIPSPNEGVIGFMYLDPEIRIETYKPAIGQMLADHFDFEGVYIKDFNDLTTKEPINLKQHHEYWEFTIGVKDHEDGPDQTIIEIIPLIRY